MAHPTVVVTFQDDISKEGKVEHISSDHTYIFLAQIYAYTHTHML